MNWLQDFQPNELTLSGYFFDRKFLADFTVPQEQFIIEGAHAAELSEKFVLRIWVENVEERDVKIRNTEDELFVHIQHKKSKRGDVTKRALYVFTRRYFIPPNVNSEAITFSIADDLLCIDMPKTNPHYSF